MCTGWELITLYTMNDLNQNSIRRILGHLQVRDLASFAKVSKECWQYSCLATEYKLNLFRLYSFICMAEYMKTKVPTSLHDVAKALDLHWTGRKMHGQQVSFSTISCCCAQIPFPFHKTPSGEHTEHCKP